MYLLAACSFRPLTALFLFLASVAGVATAQSLPGIGDHPQQLTFQIIVVDTREAADRIHADLEKGADFTATAKEKSLDPSAAGGGYLTESNIDDLRPELQTALRSVPPGKITGVVKIPTGYAILRIVPQGNHEAAASVWTSGSKDLPLTGKAVVRYPPNTAGVPDVEMVFSAIRKPDGWNSDPRYVCRLHRQSTDRAIDALRGMTAPDAGEPLSPSDQLNALYSLAAMESYQGKMDSAIADWQKAYDLAEKVEPAALPMMTEVLGSAYYHKSEVENDAYRHPGDRCIFPPTPGKPIAPYTNQEDSKKAIEYFTRYLEQKPDDLEVKWLLNLAYLTVGQYPKGVPAKYLIPPSAFASKENIGRFTDVAPESGIDISTLSGAMLVGDFENNGLLDMIVGDYDACDTVHYFHNNGDGTFTDRTREAGLSNVASGQYMLQADYNNDGCTDLLILRGAWQFPMPMTLLKNNCNGTFTDVTEQAGLGGKLFATQAGAFADIDNDGYVDLFIGNEQGASGLFRNNGDGTFEDISHSSGVDAINASFTKGVAVEDYDHDGYPDFFLSNIAGNGNNFLLHNNGNLTFTDVAAKAGVQQSWSSYASWFFDYDNDGLPDLFVASFYASVDETLRTYLNLPHGVGQLSLYKNNGDGTFKDVTKQVGLDKSFMPMGANFGDIDNDGYLDIFLGNGGPDWGALVPKTLLRNDEGKGFTDITASSGTGDLHQAHGIAFADFENNGQQDIAVTMGGAAVSNNHALRLFRNPGNSNNWVTLQLIGVKTNRSAIGARVRVAIANKGTQTRYIYRTVGAFSSFGSGPLRLEIGLGKDAKIQSIDVDWPTSKSHQTYKNVAVDSFYEITEFNPTIKKLDYQPFTLKGAPSSNLVAKGGR